MKVESEESGRGQTSLPAKYDGRATLKIRECCEATGLHRSSMDRLIQRGEFRVIRKLRHTLIPRAELERFINGN